MNVAAVRNLSLRNFLTCGYTIDVYGKGVGMNAGNNMNNYNSNGNDLNVRVKSGENYGISFLIIYFVITKFFKT